MNRVLKRPMFKMGGSSGTGITSGLDQPRKQYNQGTNPYDMGAFSPGSLPGFLTGFGLNLLSQTPTGNIFQTAATAAKEPFGLYQASQMDKLKTASERAFLKGEREAGDAAAMERLEKKIKSDETIANIRAEKEDPLFNISLEKFINDDLPPLVAERAAKFETTDADTLRSAVTGTRYGGVLTIDVRDRELVNSGAGKKALSRLNGKFVYDPYENNYKYIQIINGEIFFDEFNDIASIKLPEVKTFGGKEDKIQPPTTTFSPEIEDAMA